MSTTITTPALPRRLVAEAIGSGLLLATVVGSGIMAAQLSGGSPALALLCNTIATGAGLLALILTFGPISGAHFNPAVTLVDAWQGGMSWGDVPGYLAAQLAGAVGGVLLAHGMFDLPLLMTSLRPRAGAGQLVSEFVATFGLVAVIRGGAGQRPGATPFAVSAFITAAYWFTASTSFANPAVTIARSLTDTFTGIRPADAPAFIIAQLGGALAAGAVFRWLLQSPPPAGQRSGAPMKVFLFACVHNAGRSQMAAAWFNHLADPGLARAISAGTEPGAKVHPEVMKVMAESGIDLSQARPQHLTDDLARRAAALVTMGCGEACPHVPGLRREDWPLEDPKGKPPELVRAIRDQVRARVADLIAREGLGRAGPT